MMDRSVTRKNIMMKRMCTVHTPDALQEGSGHAAALPHLKCEMGGIVLDRLVYSL